MKIVVVGPGAIGCLFAGLLREAGLEVRLLDKNTARAGAIARGGITIDAPEGSRVVKVKAGATAGRIGCADILLVCVKSFDVGPAIRHALPAVGDRTIVVPMSNGIGNVEKIAGVVPARQIVCGITSHGSTSVGAGHVRHAGAGITMLAPFVPAGRMGAETAARVFCDAGIESRVSDDMETIIWGKLVISAAVNPLTAVMNVPNGQLLENEETRDIMRKVVLEVTAVARSKGLGLTYENAMEHAERVCRETAYNVSSMLQDIRKRRRTEVDSITGAIVREARARGIPAPVNEMLLQRVGELERKHMPKKGVQHEA